MIKVIVPVSMLKDNQVCYKITGSKQYIVKRIIRIDEQIISCDDSSVFLCIDGFIKSYSSEFEVRVDCQDLVHLHILFGYDR